MRPPATPGPASGVAAVIVVAIGAVLALLYMTAGAAATRQNEALPGLQVIVRPQLLSGGKAPPSSVRCVCTSKGSSNTMHFCMVSNL